MQRRSAHTSTPRKKYTIDAFEGIPELESAHSDTPLGPGSEDDDSAEEFQAPANDPTSDINDISSGEDEPISEGGSDAGENLLDDNLSIAEEDLKTTSLPGSTTRITRPIFPPRIRRRRRPRQDYVDEAHAASFRSRGVSEQVLGNVGVDEKRKLCYGPSPEDWGPAVKARERWAANPTLPSRSSGESGMGGMHRSFYVSEEEVNATVDEERKAWEKYGGVDALFGKQQTTSLTNEQAQLYTEGANAEAAFVMGPLDNQKLYTLIPGESMPLLQAWQTGDERQDLANVVKRQTSGYKSGFILNLGARVQCLDWAPFQDGPDYYLAVSVLPKRDPSNPAFHAPGAPAYTPQPTYKSNIQIWALKRRPDNTLDIDAGCRLESVICTSWGDVKELKFCPMPAGSSAGSSTGDLGPLATLWGDGALRILRTKAISPDPTPTYRHLDQAAFESCPPDTICTCLTWISSTRIAAGCANGFVAIWDLPFSLNSSSSYPRPTIYSSISSTYILSIASCYPSRPHLLAATSMSGYITVTDTSRSGQSIGSPASTVSNNRVRVSHKGLVWCDYAQLVLHAEDNCTLQASPIRRIFANLGAVRCKSTITTVASSPWHPSILVGTASGEVIASNPLSRALDTRPKVWQQVWFAHEWRRPTEEEMAAANDDTADGSGTCIGSNGLSRISEGYKIERNLMSKEERNQYNTHNGAVFTTVWEECSAITAVAWNPNPEVGGWAAAGMADGLLRIEDIAV